MTKITNDYRGREARILQTYSRACRSLAEPGNCQVVMTTRTERLLVMSERASGIASVLGGESRQNLKAPFQVTSGG